MVPRIKAMTQAGILVMGHLGLTPQSTQSFGGYRVQGKTKESFEETLVDAKALEEAGVFAILLEAMPSASAGQIAKQLKIPIYSIGAGSQADGQLIIMHDLQGFYQPFRPFFAKCYVPLVLPEFVEYIKKIEDLRKAGREERTDGLLVLAEMAIRKYIQEVKELKYPGEEYSYPIKENELTELRKSKDWKKREE